MARSLPVLLFLVSVLLAGCGGGGSSDLGGGITNGGITGNVQGAASAGVLPIVGATVVAVRQEQIALTRTTQTDARGDFVFTDLPLGTWSVGYTALGFVPVAAGSSGASSVYVESGTVEQAPPVILAASTGLVTSGGNVSLTLLDAATGAPINTATVTAGVASSSVAVNGVYTLAVPGTGATPVGLSAQATGYDPNTLTPAQFTFVPGQTVTLTATLAPYAVNVNGRIVVPGAFASSLSTVQIHVAGIASAFTGGTVNPTTGTFSLTLPASTSSQTRVFSLTFVSPFFNLLVVPNVVAPAGGALTLTSDVVLTPIGVGLAGTVVDSASAVPQSGSTVTIQELGVQSPIVNGSYSFAAVPTGFPLTLNATVIDALGLAETGSVVVTPTVNGGTFTVPTIVTHR